MFAIKEPSRWSGYVILSEDTLTDFVRKSFAYCDFADLDDDEKQLNIERLSEVRRTHEDLIASSDWQGLLPLIEHTSQLDWIYRQLYQNFGGDFYWLPDVLNIVEGRYNAIDKEKDDQDEDITIPLDVKAEIKIYSVAFPDSGRDEVSLDVLFASGAPKKQLIEAIRRELGELYTEKQSEMDRLLAISGGYNGLDEIQKGWIKSWLAIKVHQECAQPEIVEDDFTDYDNYPDDNEDWIFLNRHAHIKVKFPLNIENYPFDLNNLYFFLVSYNRDTNEIALQPDLDAENYWKGFGIGSWANPRGFKIKRLLLSEAHQTPMKAFVLDEGPSLTHFGVLQCGFAVTRDPGAVILRTILPGIVIIFTGLVTGLWAWLDPSHSDSVATSVMPGVLIAMIALQITAAQSIPQNSGSTRVDKFFLLTYFFVLFMILALIAPRWIKGLFLAMSLSSIAYGIVIMFKNNWRTAFNSLIGKG